MMKKSIVYVIIKGRTGNQLFQYSFARAIQSFLNSSELILDFSEIGGSADSLDMFSVVDYTAVTNGKERRSLPFPLKTKLLIYRLLRKVYTKLGWEKSHRLERVISPLLQSIGIYYQYGTSSFLNYKRPKPSAGSILIRGWFESEGYFQPARSSIKSELVLKSECPLELKEIYNTIKTRPSVCVSIRRGDFTSLEYRDEYLICSIEYYQKAVNLILQVHPESLIFICSDDVQWCKENIKFDSNPEILYEPLGLNIENKIRLMSACSHFVLSNSTFSWWVAYMSNNNDKMVVAPSVWRRITPEIKDIYMDDWQLIVPTDLKPIS